jgi:hypothetical protein
MVAAKSDPQDDLRDGGEGRESHLGKAPDSMSGRERGTKSAVTVAALSTNGRMQISSQPIRPNEAGSRTSPQSNG